MRRTECRDFALRAEWVVEEETCYVTRAKQAWVENSSGSGDTLMFVRRRGGD